MFPPIWIKSSLRVSEVMGGVAWRMESVNSSVVLVSLRMFATAERILSQDIPRLMMRADLLTELDYFSFSFTLSCFLIFSAAMLH